MSIIVVAACTCLWLLGHGVLSNPDHTQNDLGTFITPAAHVRPRFRYWLPDASVDASIVISDLRSAFGIGAGGAEFLPFYNYGGSLGVPDVDWSIYGFGTKAYVDIFKKVLLAANETGIVLDIALGPNQGQGVPSETENPGLQWDLTHSMTEIPANGSFSGIVPGWKTGARLLSVNTVHVLSEEQRNESAPLTSTFPATNWTIFNVDYDSLVDHTANVGGTDGKVKLDLPPVAESQYYQLIAIYEVQTLERACTPGQDPQDYLQNGSFIVDHFSEQGAQVVADFWEKHILGEATVGLLRQVGNYMWEDSLEINSHINWTPQLPDIFQRMHGYDVRRLLPLILWGNNNINIQSQAPGTHRFVSNRPDQDQAFTNDYRETLASCYGTYIQGLRDWSHRVLGMGLSLQVSYNLPMDALANVPNVDAPETETIQFGGGAIDSLKQFAGAAFLAGKSVLSCEFGGEFGYGYRQTLAHLLFLLNRSYAGGVNQQVIHGQTYSGEYPNTTWPGLTPFNFIVADSWSHRQPCWDNGFADLLHYAGRISFTQQSGVPKFDIAFYKMDSVTDPNFGVMYNHSDLLNSGYTYNYLSPANFFLPQATVQGGVLSPSGPSYKALVVQGSQNLTLAGSQKLFEYAQAGLPIIFAGGTPGVYLEVQNRQAALVLDVIDRLLNHTNVHEASEGLIAENLAGLGITANIASTGSESLYTTWRTGGVNETDWAFIYTDLEPSVANLTLTTNKTPNVFDPWTGVQTPLLEYERRGDTVVVPIDLAANQSLILGFTSQQTSNGPTPKFTIPKLPPNVLGYDISSEGVALKIANVSAPGSSQAIITTSDNYTLDTTPIEPPFEISAWTLTVEHWKPPANISDLTIASVKTNTTQLIEAPFRPWIELPGLNETSGLGWYSANFTWEAASDKGAYLFLDSIRHTARVTLNDRSTPALDMTNPKLDITPYLVSGTNKITILTSTTLWNAIIPVLSEVYSIGRNLVTAGLFPMQPQSQEGLIGSVRIVPYKHFLLG